jgi:hypothetical protein
VVVGAGPAGAAAALEARRLRPDVVFANDHLSRSEVVAFAAMSTSFIALFLFGLPTVAGRALRSRVRSYFGERPPEDVRIDPTKGRVERRLVEVAVVADPASDVGVEHPGKIIEGLVGPVLEAPAPDAAAEPLERLVGRRRLRDGDVIAAVQAARATMYFTGARHFFH